MNFFIVKLWERGLVNVSVFPVLSCVSGRDDYVDKIKIATEKRTIEIVADFNVYTDGSASDCLLYGGTGVVINSGIMTSPEVVKTTRRRGARFYEEKKRRPWRKRYAGYKRAKFFSGSVHILLIYMCHSVWEVYRPRPLTFKLKGLRRQITI